MGIIMFNGASSKDYGIEVEHPPKYNYPERDYTIVHVPGRNGDLVLDSESYQNVERVYELAIGEYHGDFTVLANRLSTWLHSARTYARLEDSYEPEYYRMALYKEGTSIENFFHQGGRVQVTFNCKPQRFLKEGEKAVSITKGDIWVNPTNQVAKPLIKITGSNGTFTIGDRTVTLNAINEYIMLDSELEHAYKGLTNCNANISALYFPVLNTGANTITWTGNITAVEIIPRWWTL